LKITKSIPHFGQIFFTVKAMHKVWQVMLGYTFWATFFTNSSGHPEWNLVTAQAHLIIVVFLFPLLCAALRLFFPGLNYLQLVNICAAIITQITFSVKMLTTYFIDFLRLLFTAVRGFKSILCLGFGQYFYNLAMKPTAKRYNVHLTTFIAI
jgi:hypothetical protein